MNHIILSTLAALCAAAIDGDSTAQSSRSAPLAVDAAVTRPQPDVTTCRPPLLPQAIASFGACRSGGWLYVFGGHVGRAHAHSRDNVVGTFRRLNLADGTTWQDLPAGPPLQGTALVAADDGSLYRVGGMGARNAAGDDDDLHSTASVARFDPVTGRWEEATPLPEARSSHDAIVLDDQLYVVGGWQLDGDDDGTWLDTAWVADLGEQPLRWRHLPAPGRHRRAAALATFGKRLVLLGGIDGHRPTTSVQVFDTVTGTWSDGPELPGAAFGTAAHALGEHLYATLMDGRIVRWDGAGWQPAAQFATPRFFHRLLPDLAPDTLLAIGGAAHAGHLRTIERLSLSPTVATAIREYVLPAPGEVGYRQALVLHDEVLWAFGGNRDRDGDRFAAEQFADDIWRVDLTSMNAQRAGTLPFAAQSMAAAPIGTRGEHLLVGGLGLVAGEPRSLDAAWRWRPRTGELTRFATAAQPRTQCRVLAHDGRIWQIGGIDFAPDADGGTTGDDCRELLVCDPDQDQPRFAPSGVRLPRPRRSFGAAMVGSRLFLIGGLGDGFEPAGPCDVYDFATGTWNELPAPRDWVSPQVAVIGDRLYVACGGTMRGQRFTPDDSLVELRADGTWITHVEHLPFAVRHVQMLPLHNRLLFYDTDAAQRRIVLRLLQPDATHLVPASTPPF